MLSPIDKGKRIHCAAKQTAEISKQYPQTSPELVVLAFEQNIKLVAACHCQRVEDYAFHLLFDNAPGGRVPVDDEGSTADERCPDYDAQKKKARSVNRVPIVKQGERPGGCVVDGHF